MVQEVFLFSALAGLIFLDSAILGQWMISQPVICAPILGLLGGDPMAGLIIGALLQLFWAGSLPIGSSSPPEISITAMVTTISYLVLQKLIPISLVSSEMVWLLCFGIGAGIVGGQLTISLRHFNNRFAALADIFISHEKGDRLDWIPLLSMGNSWIINTLLIFLCSMLSIIIVRYIHGTGFQIRMFYYYFWLLIPLSAAIILELFHVERKFKILIMGLGIGLLLGYFTVWMGR